MPLAVPATSGDHHASGFFLLTWGLIASAIGWGILTDFRGFADTFTRSAMSSASGLRRIPPWKRLPRRSADEELAERRRLVRFIAIPFALLGPIVTVAGVVEMLHGRIAVSRGPALPLPFALAYIALALVFAVQHWRRGDFLRRAAEQGGWVRVTAFTTTLGALSFGVFAAFGQTTIAVAGSLVAGLSAAAIAVYAKPEDDDASPADEEPATSMPPEPSAPTAPDEAGEAAEADGDDEAFRWH